MKVAVLGATGVVGTSVLRALVGSGNDVFALAGTPDKRALLESWGATAVPADLFDQRSLVAMFEGCDAVVNAVTRIPVGLRAMRSAAWRENDRIRTEGVRIVSAAARAAHVRRLVQGSVSVVYADQGDTWIDERSPLDINAATEPACVAEAHVQEYQSDLRRGVVLRFGTVIGEDPQTRFNLRLARRGRPIGLGSPEGWVHPLHTDDIGSAIAAALGAPGGVYNVGAEPVRRAAVVQAYAAAVGRESVGFVGPLLRRLTGERTEPVTRSLRVSSEHFRATTGWTPRRERFDASWLEDVDVTARVCP
jgi:nucleoside-diphosphate-sugar epimerase